MPQKRKGGNLHKVSRKDRRSRQRRKIESSEIRSQRLEANAHRNAQQRADENDDARSQRLKADAQRHAQQRADENDDTRSQRLKADAQETCSDKEPSQTIESPHCANCQRP
ncbi:arginine serine-rich coiled-coil protein 2-like isoform x2 protein [Lasius niger]|uniref:Arginine serine-rich coiled-coil protein 2-like isoform x2 protein n=1 Tax=Lasius niger TaxID=67767 RepID=A0A0J7K0Z2_LASNI|nr:arginine serine-rich coiled-coil protein 2-like isoform x2 protein [Lasius niger]